MKPTREQIKEVLSKAMYEIELGLAGAKSPKLTETQRLAWMIKKANKSKEHFNEMFKNGGST